MVLETLNLTLVGDFSSEVVTRPADWKAADDIVTRTYLTRQPTAQHPDPTSSWNTRGVHLALQGWIVGMHFWASHLSITRVSVEHFILLFLLFYFLPYLFTTAKSFQSGSVYCAFVC